MYKRQFLYSSKNSFFFLISVSLMSDFNFSVNTASIWNALRYIFAKNKIFCICLLKSNFLYKIWIEEYTRVYNPLSVFVVIVRFPVWFFSGFVQTFHNIFSYLCKQYFFMITLLLTQKPIGLFSPRKIAIFILNRNNY